MTLKLLLLDDHLGKRLFYSGEHKGVEKGVYSRILDTGVENNPEWLAEALIELAERIRYHFSA